MGGDGRRRRRELQTQSAVAYVERPKTVHLYLRWLLLYQKLTGTCHILYLSTTLIKTFFSTIKTLKLCLITVLDFFVVLDRVYDIF